MHYKTTPTIYLRCSVRYDLLWFDGCIAEMHENTRTKAGQEMLSRIMESLRQSIMVKQVAGGKEFKVHSHIYMHTVIIFNCTNQSCTYTCITGLVSFTHSWMHTSVVLS